MTSRTRSPVRPGTPGQPGPTGPIAPPQSAAPSGEPSAPEGPGPLGGIIGTAGHVDHGKTTLVRALTGVDTDRLPEERRRGISIDLGFAEMRLPDGRRAGVVDVPGHERFIKNMVAGASGIDLCLLVVAADEGVMPQTREHVDIACLLGVSRGVVALTKADLVEEAWLDLVREDVRALLRDTPLRGAPLIPVSARTGAGLAELRRALAEGLAGAEAHHDRGFARLPVDRVFTVPGFGTVVTGTLTSGSIAVDDRLDLLPAGLSVRVRALQVHGQAVDRGRAGQRVAVNLGGSERSDVARGDVLAAPGTLRGEVLLAVRLHALPERGRDIRHGQRVHVHVGTAEAVGRILLLEGDAASLPMGASSLALLRLERPLAVGRGDRFIVRSYSPVTTVGGGHLIDVGRRYRRRNPADLRALAILERGDPAEVVLAAARDHVPLAVGEVARRAGLPVAEAEPQVRSLLADGRLVALGAEPAALPDAPLAPSLLVTPAASWEDLRQRVLDHVAAYHARHPLRQGMPREELRRAALAGLAGRGAVRAEAERVALADFRPALPPVWEEAAARLGGVLEAAGLAPPAIPELLGAVGFEGEDAERAEFLGHLAEQGRIVRVGDLCFARGPVDAAAEQVRAFLRAHGTITVAQMRDLLGVTRKHAVPLAEYLDGAHVTRREGDVRRLA